MSSILEDKYLEKEFQELFKLDVSSEAFTKKVNELLLYSYDKAYTLVVPSANIVLALNKEVIYEPSKMALSPLWNAKITPYHWSIRKGELKQERLEYLYPKRLKNE